MNFTDRQIEIIEAATVLIGVKGIQNLTTKNLANAMNFSEPSLYRHFKDKNEILISILYYYRNNMKSTLADIMNQDITGLEKLESIMQFQFSHFAKNPAIVLVIFAETSFQHNQILSDAVLSILNQKRSQIETIIKHGQQDNSIRKDVDYDQLASIYMGSMRITVLNWRLNNYKENLIEEGKKLWGTLKALVTTL